MSERTPDQIAPDLGEVYWFWKDSEAEKEILRKQFFDACTQAAIDKGLAQKTVIVPDDIVGTETIGEFTERYNSGWKVISVHGAKVLIEEDPALKGTTEVVILSGPVEDRNGNLHPGYVVTKTIVGGSAMVDTERMEQLDYDLYEHITQFKGFAPDWDMGSVILDLLIENDWPREIRSDLNEQDIESIKEYSYEGPRSAKLNVRYAKPDESPGG